MIHCTCGEPNECELTAAPGLLCRPMQRMALATNKRILPKDDPSIGTGMGNLVHACLSCLLARIVMMGCFIFVRHIVMCGPVPLLGGIKRNHKIRLSRVSRVRDTTPRSAGVLTPFVRQHPSCLAVGV